jgi:hypothetical protein
MSDQSDFTVGVEQFDDGGEQFYDDAHEQQYEQPYDDELAAADGRVAELEQQLAGREAEALVAAHRELNDRAAALELVQVSARLAEALGAPELSDRPAVSARIHEARLQLDGDRGQGTPLDPIDKIFGSSRPLGRRSLPF